MQSKLRPLGNTEQWLYLILTGEKGGTMKLAAGNKT
jgi:hypothetical protein